MFWRSDCCHRCFHRRSWRSFVSGVVAALLLILAGAAWLHGSPSPSHPGPGRHATTAPRPARTAGSHREHAGDRRPGTDQHARHRTRRASGLPHGHGGLAPRTAQSATAQLTTTSRPRPPDLTFTWVPFHGINLPVSRLAGPRDTRGGLASGFADTPAGALPAAINIAVRTAAQLGPGIFTPTITRQVTGPDAKALLTADIRAYRQLTAATAAAGGADQATSPQATEVGYRFAAWSMTAATVDVVTAGPGEGGISPLTVTRVEVIWQHGDWRVLAPAAGSWSSSAATVPSLAGYLTFPRNSR